MIVEVKGGAITDSEKQAYINYAKEAHKNCTIDKVD